MGWRPLRFLRVDSNWISRDFWTPDRLRIVLGIFNLSAALLGVANLFDLRVKQAAPPST